MPTTELSHLWFVAAVICFLTMPFVFRPLFRHLLSTLIASLSVASAPVCRVSTHEEVFRLHVTRGEAFWASYDPSASTKNKEPRQEDMLFFVRDPESVMRVLKSDPETFGMNERRRHDTEEDVVEIGNLVQPMFGKTVFHLTAADWR
jgi:hypothetical protein